MPIINTTDETFQKEVIESEKVTIVDMWAPWCSPCKAISLILSEIAEEMKEVKICKHNIDSDPNFPTKYNIRSIPTLLLFSNKELKDTKVGLTNKKDIKSFIKKNL
jgi:thioredoxin 1